MVQREMIRGKQEVWPKALDLTNKALQATSGLNLPHGDHWTNTVIVFLHLANERLDSIRQLIIRGHNDSSVILVRSFFELAVNLAFIRQDVARRLPEYLRHGGIPTSEKEVDELKEKIAKFKDGQIKAEDIVPHKSWKAVVTMCRKLRGGWPKEYEVFYRSTSVPAHAGSFTLASNFVRLLEQQPIPDHDKASVLVTALDFHLRIAQMAAEVFSNEIQLQTLKELINECQGLGQSVVAAMK